MWIYTKYVITLNVVWKWSFLLFYSQNKALIIAVISEVFSIVLGVFFSNGKMWTCSGTRRITAASKRSEFPPLTFGGLIWFSTTSMLWGYIWSGSRPSFFSLFYHPFFITGSSMQSKASKPPETIIPPVSDVLNHTFLYSTIQRVWKLRFHQAKSGLHVAGPPSPNHMLHLTHCCFSPTTSFSAITTCAKLSAGWLGCATVALTQPRALMSPCVNI